MVYTKIIRNYCLQNPGIVFDVALEYKEHFNMIPYHSYIKFLLRLAEEGVLYKYSRKAYLITTGGKFDYEGVVKYYTNQNHGVVIGYRFYNEIGITNFVAREVDILTNMIETKTKTIGDYRLEKIDIPEMRQSHINVIRILELLENRSNIIDRDESRIDDMLQVYIGGYNGIVFEEVIRNRKYSYSTICSLDRLLKLYSIREYGCIEIYNRVYFK